MQFGCTFVGFLIGIDRVFRPRTTDHPLVDTYLFFAVLTGEQWQTAWDHSQKINIQKKKRLRYIENQIMAVGINGVVTETISKFMARQIADHGLPSSKHKRSILLLLVKARSLYSHDVIAEWVQHVIEISSIFPIYWAATEQERRLHTEAVVRIESSNGEIETKNRENIYINGYTQQVLDAIPVFNGQTYATWYEKWSTEPSMFRTTHVTQILKQCLPSVSIAIVIGYCQPHS